MADEKKTKLEIVIGAIDNATAGIKAIRARISGLTAPFRLIGESLSGLAATSGLGEIVEGFKGVGSALKDVLGKLLAIGGAAAAAVVGLFALVGQFDDLGDKAEMLGVSVDFLAQMRFAAEKSGASVESLDSGLQTLALNLGQARAGIGKMTGFLNIVSPALLRQLKATKSNAEAFDLLANAMAKIKDPAKRLAFAQKTIGDPSLAPLLAKGAAGVAELRKRYLELAGSQEGAAAAAGPVDDAMKDLKAATDGIKAALVEGLSPALQQLVEELKAWFGENRARIAEWVKDWGKKLPAAIHKFADAFLHAIDVVADIIDSLGGFKTVAIAVAGVIAGPLIAAVVSLGIAILSTPIGWIVAGFAAFAVAAVLMVKHWDDIKETVAKVGAVLMTTPFGWVVASIAGLIGLANQLIQAWDPISDFFIGLWDGVVSVFERAWEIIKGIVDKVSDAVDSIGEFFTGDGSGPNPFAGGGPFANPGGRSTSDLVGQAVGALQAARGGVQKSEVSLKVDFANTPRGTRVTADPRSSAHVDMTVGYQMLHGVTP